MLSRIMRHPAGLMKRALGGRFLAAAPKESSADAPLYPAYWSHRYSGLGLLLATPAAAAHPPAPVAPMAAGHAGKAFLPAQDGKASSYLSTLDMPNTPNAPKVPAARP